MLQCKENASEPECCRWVQYYKKDEHFIMTRFNWSLECSECSTIADAGGLPTVCPDCGAPWLVKYDTLPDPVAKESYGARQWSMWRYHDWMPLTEGETPVSLGEGATPMIPVPRFAEEFGLTRFTFHIKYGRLIDIIYDHSGSG